MKIIGRREYVDIPELGLLQVEAKLDTGAYTSSVHCEEVLLKEVSGIPTLVVSIITSDSETKKEFHFNTFTLKKFRNSFGEMEERYVIKSILKIGNKQILASFSLSKRDKMKYPVLLGRRPIKGRFLIDVSHLHLGGKNEQ
ncbi:MAG: ATP-dependent zinc protease [Sphingobacteriaceae bacterium]|nr:ATP-dependent zinc protease [Sphingobacteriaceae bacterium]